MIVTYLIKALTEKESVFVTNLGLFSQQYQAAQIRDGQIIPPCHKVVFDPNYDGNGFAFTMFVSMKAGLLTSDATVKVTQWVNELKNALDNNKSVNFENFGTFAKNGDGIITFESDRISELNIEFEGMETVPLSHQAVGVAVENQEEKEKEDNTPTTNIEEEPISTTTAEPEKTDVKNTDEVQTTLVDNLEEATTEENKEYVTAEEYANRLTESEEAPSTIADIEKSDNQAVEEEKQTTMVENENIATTVEEDDKNDEIENGNANDNGEDDNEEDNDTQKKQKKRRAWPVIVIIIVVLAILDALGYIFREEIEKFYNQQIDRNDTEEVEAQESEDFIYETPQDTYAEIDSTAEETDMESIEADENAIATQQNNATQATTGNGLTNDDNFVIRFEKGKHYVIAGSFPTESDVRKHIKQQHLEKYNPKAVKQDGVSNLRVCIGIFDNEADAENFRDSVNAKYWVLN